MLAADLLSVSHKISGLQWEGGVCKKSLRDFSGFAWRLESVQVCAWSVVFVCSGREVFVSDGRDVFVSGWREVFVCADRQVFRLRQQLPPPRASRFVFI
ncbi:hypothetical protein [Methanimicrococcus hongohii]|uniref:hypothetical protein n=1 Tax=Methanimicrococcus hongohii TaxID=3028295 RepID=UPI00292D6D7A|nr:hypothetical protein [Methanimicrococcus sp. Hf6]